jgi:RNA polymerase sigma-70 factor (ECF subfamily)
MAERASERSLHPEEADASLVRRLQNGDGAAQAELCRRFGPVIHRFATARLAGNRDLAEDIMVEVLVDGVRNFRRFDPRKATLSAWLHGIARHRLQRARRKQRRSTSVPDSALVPLDSLQELVLAPDPASLLAERLATRQQVSRLTRVLTDVEMEVVVLRCLGEFPTKEIARIVGRSERATESLLLRAKQKAREELGKDA